MSVHVLATYCDLLLTLFLPGTLAGASGHCPWWNATSAFTFSYLEADAILENRLTSNIYQPSSKQSHSPSLSPLMLRRSAAWLLKIQKGFSASEYAAVFCTVYQVRLNQLKGSGTYPDTMAPFSVKFSRDSHAEVYTEGIVPLSMVLLSSNALRLVQEL